MTITLPPRLAVFVSYAVRTGRYPSERQMLFEALTLLSERDLAARVPPATASAADDGSGSRDLTPWRQSRFDPLP